MNVTMQNLIESGLYFGHPSKHFDSRMKPYLFGKRQGIFIIDLQKTMLLLEKAGNFLRESAADGKEILVVGTKRQVRDLIREAAEETGYHYITNRWLGGILTNFQTVKVRIDRLNELEAKEAAGDFEKVSKKDAAVARVEKDRLFKNLRGLRRMTRIPDVMLVFDAKKEENAIREARKAGLVIVAVVDTNANPELVAYPIPANDDGIKGLRLLFSELQGAILAGREARRLQARQKAEQEQEDRKQKPPSLPEEEAAAVPVVAMAETSAAEAQTVVVEKEKEGESVPTVAGVEEVKEKEAVKRPKPRPRIRAKVRRGAATEKKSPAVPDRKKAVKKAKSATKKAAETDKKDKEVAADRTAARKDTGEEAKDEG